MEYNISGSYFIEFCIVNVTSNPAQRAGLNRDVVCSGQGLPVVPVFH